jgi:signal transduction histidine kinase
MTNQAAERSAADDNAREARAAGGSSTPVAGAMTRGRWRAPLTSLAARFLVVNAAVVFVAAIVIGMLVGNQIESSVVNRTASLAALYVDSFVEPHLHSLVTQPTLTAEETAALSTLLADTALGQRVVSFKIWSPEGRILFSPYAPLIGQTIPLDEDIARSFNGEVVADISNLDNPENALYERQRWSRLLETYIPVRSSGSDRILAVTEFYSLPDELDNEVATARQRSWLLVALVALVSYLALAGIVKQGSDTILRQERDLVSRVDRLSELLEQNARLNERVRRAAESSTLLNEQALRRVSGDLHDGAGQALALALLRLDMAQTRIAPTGAEELEADLAVVKDAIADGLDDMRVVAAGIRLPELESRTVTEAAERAVSDHMERTGIPVDLEVKEGPIEAPHAVKIALFRTLQEGLSNATRHGGGIDLRIRLRGDAEAVHLELSDGGPGFDPGVSPGEGHLGLASMRERAELLGGTFEIESRAGHGTRIMASWPL